MNAVIGSEIGSALCVTVVLKLKQLNTFFPLTILNNGRENLGDNLILLMHQL